MDTTKGRITHDRELGEGEKETHIALMGVEREREKETHITLKGVREWGEMRKHRTKRGEGLVIAYSIEMGGVQ